MTAEQKQAAIANRTPFDFGGDMCKQPQPVEGAGTKWSHGWDLTTIPDDLLYSEAARRRGAKGGRPGIIRPCPSCARPLTQTQRRAGCECGQRFPRKDPA